MTHRDVPHHHRHFARTLRADATWAENRLWQVLRAKHLGGFNFRRQVPLDGYNLDFVCFEARVIVEVDGHQHAESERDARRDVWFRSQGLRVLRIWNGEVEENLDGVCSFILGELRNCGE
ncbi:MAG: endonuclease domain-containing protein [Rhizobium rhizophilum]|uniref:endonuclease domain-containing protein n=1 Tax=Rhizobium rhizophilum TaxID=1850373 RepID=UPI0039194626